MDNDEAEKLRRNDIDDRDEFSRAEETGAAGSPSVIAATTTITTYPTTVNCFFGVIAQDVYGPEIEGGTGTLTTRAAFFAYNTGSSLPPIGAKVLCTFVNSRWVFQYDG